MFFFVKITYLIHTDKHTTCRVALQLKEEIAAFFAHLQYLSFPFKSQISQG